MAKSTKKSLSAKQIAELLSLLKTRFVKNMNRHKGIEWTAVEAKLKAKPDQLWSLNEMEATDGEPDVVAFDQKTKEYHFFDCAPETPNNRRSICYDAAALASRKEFKPKHSAVGMATEMGIEILTEDQYLALQQLGSFDTKTSSWLSTPAPIRKLGGAIFGDRRYDKVFVYHNGAESYYAARGFRGCIKI